MAVTRSARDVVLRAAGGYEVIFVTEYCELVAVMRRVRDGVLRARGGHEVSS